MPDAAATDAIRPENAALPAVQEQPLDKRLDDYLLALARQHPFAIQIKADSENILAALEENWPVDPRWEEEARELWGKIVDLVYPFAANVKAHYVVLVITVGTALKRPALPEDHGVIYAGFDAVRGVMRRHFIAPHAGAVSGPEEPIAAGMIVTGQPLDYNYYRHRNVVRDWTHPRGGSLFHWTEAAWNALAALPPYVNENPYPEEREEAVKQHAVFLARLRALLQKAAEEDEFENFRPNAGVAAAPVSSQTPVRFALPPAAYALERELLTIAADENVAPALRATVRELAQELRNLYPSALVEEAAFTTTAPLSSISSQANRLDLTPASLLVIRDSVGLVGGGPAPRPAAPVAAPFARDAGAGEEREERLTSPMQTGTPGEAVVPTSLEESPAETPVRSVAQPIIPPVVEQPPVPESGIFPNAREAAPAATGEYLPSAELSREPLSTERQPTPFARENIEEVASSFAGQPPAITPSPLAAVEEGQYAVTGAELQPQPAESAAAPAVTGQAPMTAEEQRPPVPRANLQGESVEAMAPAVQESPDNAVQEQPAGLATIPAPQPVAERSQYAATTAPLPRQQPAERAAVPAATDEQLPREQLRTAATQAEPGEIIAPVAAEQTPTTTLTPEPVAERRQYSAAGVGLHPRLTESTAAPGMASRQSSDDQLSSDQLQAAPVQENLREVSAPTVAGQPATAMTPQAVADRRQYAETGRSVSEERPVARMAAERQPEALKPSAPEQRPAQTMLGARAEPSGIAASRRADETRQERRQPVPEEKIRTAEVFPVPRPAVPPEERAYSPRPAAPTPVAVPVAAAHPIPSPVHTAPVPAPPRGETRIAEAEEKPPTPPVMHHTPLQSLRTQLYGSTAPAMYADKGKPFELAGTKTIIPRVAGSNGAAHPVGHLYEFEPLEQKYWRHKLEVEKKLELASDMRPAPSTTPAKPALAPDTAIPPEPHRHLAPLLDAEPYDEV